MGKATLLKRAHPPTVDELLIGFIPISNVCREPSVPPSFHAFPTTLTVIRFADFRCFAFGLSHVVQTRQFQIGVPCGDHYSEGPPKLLPHNHARSPLPIEVAQLCTSRERST